MVIRRDNMALVDVTCNRCGIKYQMDIGEKSLDDVKSILAKRDYFQCPGHHFEGVSPLNFITFGEIHEGVAPTDKDWYEKMQELHGELYVSDELPARFDVLGFSSGLCVVKEHATGETVTLSYRMSPSGIRHYYKV